MAPMIEIPEMLLVGSFDRNAGKTEFACSIINKYADRSIVGVKVTAIRESDGSCPRGGEGCGVCTSLDGDFIVTDEKDAPAEKDTARLLAAGAEKVLWLRVLKSQMRQGVEALMAQIVPGSIIVCESNSLREVVQPGVFVMVKSDGDESLKESAVSVRDHADVIVESNGSDFNFDYESLFVDGGGWMFTEKATAVIMAGGESTRIGQDKAMLLIDGVPMIERVYKRLKPHFMEVIVSAGRETEYGFLNAKVVGDRFAGGGPLVGIASVLEATESDINLIVACDMPEIDIPFARRLLREADGCDVVVSRHDGQIEPLFAVYKKSVLDSIDEMLHNDERQIRSLFDKVATKYVELPRPDTVVNLNTMTEYKSYTGKI